MTENTRQPVQSRIWREEAEANNPFATRVAWCHGYDVYGDMLGKARWVDMLYLLFRGEAPATSQARLLEALAVTLANPGPRDPSVHAAMCSGTCGSPAAASLMAALAVGAGQLNGGREIFLAVQDWNDCGTDIEVWCRRLKARPPAQGVTPWPPPEHPPGYEPHGIDTRLIVIQTLNELAKSNVGPYVPWLSAHVGALEKLAGLPLGLAGVVAAAYADLGFSPDQAEMLHLLLRLPGAAVHALEQGQLGHKKFPFYEIEFAPPKTSPAQENTR
jgi:citrate synthase